MATFECWLIETSPLDVKYNGYLKYLNIQLGLGKHASLLLLGAHLYKETRILFINKLFCNQAQKLQQHYRQESTTSNSQIISR